MMLFKQNKRLQKVVLLFSFFLLFIIYLSSDFKVECPLYKITHLYCPGCGITRCLIELLHFHFYQAFRYNPYVFLLLPLIILYLLYQIYIWIMEKEDKVSNQIPRGILNFFIITLIIYGVIRNISYFSWLAPTVIN